MGDSNTIIQSARETVPPVRRISELTDIDDLEVNKEEIENNSYIVLANKQEQKNYKKSVSSIKTEISDEINENIEVLDDRISSIESKINDILNGGTVVPTGPITPTEQIRYYFWIIDESHLSTNIGTTNIFDSNIVSCAVNSTVNSCPFLADESYNVVDILTEKFDSVNFAEKVYLILPQPFLKYTKTTNTNIKINGKLLTTNGFILNVNEINTQEYKLSNTIDTYKISYIIIELTNNLSTGLSLNL